MKKLIWFLPLLLVSFLAMSCTEAPPAATEVSDEGLSKKPTKVVEEISFTDVIDCGDGFEMQYETSQSHEMTFFWDKDGNLDRIFFQSLKGTFTYSNPATGKSVTSKTGPSNHGFLDADGNGRWMGMCTVVHVPGHGPASIMAGYMKYENWQVVSYGGRISDDNAGCIDDRTPLCDYLRSP